MRRVCREGQKCPFLLLSAHLRKARSMDHRNLDVDTSSAPCGHPRGVPAGWQRNDDLRKAPFVDSGLWRADGYPRQGFGRAVRQCAAEPSTRADPELHEDVAQVPFDRTWADE